MKIFLMKSESFLSLISKVTTTLKPQKGSKDIIKVMHMTRVLCLGKTKHNILF